MFQKKRYRLKITPKPWTHLTTTFCTIVIALMASVSELRSLSSPDLCSYSVWQPQLTVSNSHPEMIFFSLFFLSSSVSSCWKQSRTLIGDSSFTVIPESQVFHLMTRMKWQTLHWHKLLHKILHNYPNNLTSLLPVCLRFKIPPLHTIYEQ